MQNGADLSPKKTSDDAVLLQKQGIFHETAYLEALQSQGRDVYNVAASSLEEGARRTKSAIKAGYDVIYQGALWSGNWAGWADFIERVPNPSDLGDFSYEIVDTKLKQTPHPKHVLQLCIYSRLLADIQGVFPTHAHIELGNGARQTFRLLDFEAYVEFAQRRFQSFVVTPTETRPVPCSDCGLCKWADICEATWREQDSLFNVAGITRGQVQKLEAAGILTVRALAAHKASIRSISDTAYHRIWSQARLQNARKHGQASFEVRPHVDGKGFDLLPRPQPGDMFYDIEGDPHYPGGLEYLHGLWFDGTFKAFWAHDHKEERIALKQLFEVFKNRLRQYDNARIYHYAPYEITALRRLAAKHGEGEAFLDSLLREKRFVDLYSVVRGGIFVSEPSYSLKYLEVFYGLERKGEIKTAGGSVVAYEAWRDNKDQSILDEIEEYNKIDCLSTERLRDWLLSIRPVGPWPTFSQDLHGRHEQEDQQASLLRERLSRSALPVERQELLYNLAFFHKREAKPSWWAIFDSLGKEDDELIDDLDALSGLVADGPAYPDKRSMCRRYRFPPQETKLRAGKDATVASNDSFSTLHVVDIDRLSGSVVLKVGNSRAELLGNQLALHPAKPIDSQVISDALSDVVYDQLGDVQRYKAVDDLLSQRIPRLKRPRTDILDGLDPVEGTIAAVQDMQATVLPIQGPPGTGKTYVTARAILTLVQQGYRVGVSSNSHEAIRNVLTGCLEALDGGFLSTPVDIVHKISGSQDDYDEKCRIRCTTSNAEASCGRNIVGGTAFFFSRDENIQAFDWLFVDEAGQVGLATMAAMARAAHNLVLVGDPQQLPQVVQGSHPEPANLSCFEWILGNATTIPPERGIFLPVSRRMHPRLCQFISDLAYEGRLESFPDTSNQSVHAPPYPKAGAHWVSVRHEGNSQVAVEEIQYISDSIDSLISGTYIDKSRSTSRLTYEDIIVVAPYNAQVNALRDSLPAGVRVGTVDKFQGQEAPVCLISMTASRVDDSSRGIDFLFSLNRLNVAISRAKTLALVFGSPKLREVKCENITHMKLVNALCTLPDCTTPVA